MNSGYTKHNRKSIRLPNYDYSQEGAYFITICTHKFQHLFGKIGDGKMILDNFGKIAETEWFRTSKIRPNIELREFVVMPNHLHGIIIITDSICTGDLQSPKMRPTGPKSGSIGAIIAGYKSTVSKQINQIRKTPGVKIWHRNYYEHIIRNENEYEKIATYIINNPLQWHLDRFYN